MADTRDISMHFWATQEEYDLIQKNMALSGGTNLSAFLRKMAIDGMVIKLDSSSSNSPKAMGNRIRREIWFEINYFRSPYC